MPTDNEIADNMRVSVEMLHKLKKCTEIDLYEIQKSRKVKRILPDNGNCVILSTWENHRAKAA